MYAHPLRTLILHVEEGGYKTTPEPVCSLLENLSLEVNEIFSKKIMNLFMISKIVNLDVNFPCS